MLKPEINFATADPVELDIEVVKTVEAYLGRQLARADPLRLFLRGVEQIILQQRLLIDQTAKMNLLAFSEGIYLDALAQLVGVERLSEAYATVTGEVTLSTSRLSSTLIKKGTRIQAGDNVFFALDDDLIFPAGETVKTAKMHCLQAGTAGNDYLPGELKNIVDPQPWLLSIKNITTSAGGADTEDDESLRERIRLAVESFTCAGSEGAYIFHAKSAAALIGDVAVHSPAPGFVDVYVLLKDGLIPSAEILSLVDKKLNAKTVRPLTDTVTVKEPVQINFDLKARYWINIKDSASAAQIVENVENAVEEYILWQKSRLGRDINPSKLIALMMAAGAKRVEIDKPVFTPLNNFSVALVNQKNISYSGLEDD